MQITVLGSGGFGYPLAFCDCEYCNGARKLGGKNIRKRASILINDEMVIDLTPDCQTAMAMYNKNLGKVKYLLQTHTHLDHFDTNEFTTLDFKYETRRNENLTLICSELCLQDIQSKASRYDKMNLFDEKYLNSIKLKTKTINHGDKLKIGKYEIKAIHCSHDEKIGAQLYLIKCNGKVLFYATDTSQLTDLALNELKNEKVDCMFLDESFGFRDYCFSHLNINGFVEFVNKLREHEILSKNCQVYATHLTHDGNPLHDELEKILNEYKCHVAYDGQVIEL